jgi:hypothetical protein
MKNIYDIAACNTAIKALKAFPVTCRLKNMHRSKLWALRDLVNDYCFPLNRILFDEDYCELSTYKQSVLSLYNERTKAQLDSVLRYTVNILIEQVKSCIETEYQTRDGRLVPHPTRLGEWIERK